MVHTIRTLAGGDELAPQGQAYTDRLGDAGPTYTAAIPSLGSMHTKLGTKKVK